MAQNFKLTNKSIIQRIKDLESSGHIKGVLDERGKYIYISNEEIGDLLKIVATKGKLSKGEIIEEFSKIIRLEPDDKDLEAIKAYDLKYASEMQNEFDSYMNQS